MTKLSKAAGEPEAEEPGVCEVLRILGAKWTFLVLEELLVKGTQRFNQLRRNTPISTQSLTDTLRRVVRIIRPGEGKAGPTRR